MIPNTRPLTARYVSDDGAKVRVGAKPVAAWSDDGEALVVDKRNGRLVLAGSYAGFDGLDTDDRYIAVVDGQGWTVGPVGDESARVPVIGFAISETGDGTPIMCDGDGMVDPDRLSTDTVFHPPGGWPEDREAGDGS